MSTFSRNRLQPWAALLGVALLVLLLAAAVLFAGDLPTTLFYLTGEEQAFAQVKGLTDLAAGIFRQPLQLANDVPVRYADANPFGVNVFLNQEVEPAKRERTVQMAAQAGFHWLRQEFPWEDIEIHGKGDFEDRRTQPARSAWDKYDQIVALAERHGMELIVRLSTPPAWSRTRGREVGDFAPPDRFEDYGDFVSAVVTRYRGRIRYYQIWNEPNIYPEWGNYTINPENYTQLLEIGSTRAREASPDVVIISGALAGTIRMQPDPAPGGNAMSDLLFLQRMYDAGAGPYFDIMAMQGYGLWSGPTDRRMHPRVINFSRPQYVRDLMVANGDASKPIWISEMGWNAVPDEVEDKRFGQVSLENQGRYAALAYQRAAQEWPWMGVINTWYLKRATDEWEREGRPEAYFKLVNPDFTTQPAYETLKATLTSLTPVLYPGPHAPDGWAAKREGEWQAQPDPGAPYGAVYRAGPGARLSFTFDGTDVLATTRCAAGPCNARLLVRIDGEVPRPVSAAAEPEKESRLPLAQGLPDGPHGISVEVREGTVDFHALVVERHTFPIRFTR